MTQNEDNKFKTSKTTVVANSNKFMSPRVSVENTEKIKNEIVEFILPKQI